MCAYINSFQMSVGDRDFMLVDVSHSLDIIGTVNITGKVTAFGEKPTISKLLYVHDEPLINIISTSKGDEYSNKLINQVGSLTTSDDKIKTLLSTISDNYFTYNQNLTKSLQPLFEILSDGLYVCHVSKMIPSDGSGNFFWNAFNLRHEVLGSSDFNRVMGKESNYIPCFLIPTINISEFSDSKVKAQSEKIKSKKSVGGIAYHVSGMFSALLDGHHSATACLLNDTDFNCIVVEPLRNILYENEEQAAEFGREPKIIALSCPFVKIPIGSIPPQMLESFLLKRSGTKPNGYLSLRSKVGKTLRTVSRRTISRDVLLKAELLPDTAMIESAHAITGLSDEQLNALLTGETKCNDKTIISNNYYNSIVIACNYLQYADFDRFLAFALSILGNPDLTATHKYLIDRLAGINNKDIRDFFKSILDGNDPLHSEFTATADAYIKNYERFLSENMVENERIQKLNQAMNMVDGEMGSLGLAKMEAFIKKSRK